jgi:hypothetical protein
MNKNVWFDTTNLTYGSVLKAMGEAVDNAYVILLCINEAYSKSEYCLMGESLVVTNFSMILTESIS